MRAEDEPITLKEKACRTVCRRQSVMIERRNPLFAVTQVTRKVTKFREKNSEGEQIRSLLDWQGDYGRRSIQKFEGNDRVAARRTSLCSSWRTTSTRSSTSSWTAIEAKLTRPPESMCVVVLVSAHRHTCTCTAWLKSWVLCLSPMSSTCVHEVSVSLRPCSFFFFRKMKLKNTSRVKCQNCHASRPACRSSFTTSWEAGTSPSTPPASRKSSNEAAKARAAAHAKIPPQRRRHACSTLFLQMCGSLLAFALARRLKNLRVSSDHRPPTSSAKTTKRTLARGVTSSG